MKVNVVNKLKELPRNRGGKCVSALLVGLLACCAALAIVVRAHNQRMLTVTAIVERPKAVTPVALSLAPAAVQASAPPQRLQARLVTIRPYGFEPKDITHPAGRFLLAVDNRSGLKEVVLRLDRMAGSRLHEVRVPRQQLDWRQMVDLTPGSYLLTEASHANWICNITITP